MAWIRRNSNTLASILLFVSSVVVLASLGATMLDVTSRAILLDVLSAVGALLIAITGLVGLRTWRRRASRELAQRVLQAALTLRDRAHDWSISGSSGAKALASLVADSGEIIDSPWATRDEVLWKIVADVEASRRSLFTAKLAWAVALEEARASSWEHVADVGDRLTTYVELFNAQLARVQSMGTVWVHCSQVAEPAKKKAKLQQLGKHFDEVTAQIGNAAGEVQENLGRYLGL